MLLFRVPHFANLSVFNVVFWCYQNHEHQSIPSGLHGPNMCSADAKRINRTLHHMKNLPDCHDTETQPEKAPHSTCLYCFTEGCGRTAWHRAPLGTQHSKTHMPTGLRRVLPPSSRKRPVTQPRPSGKCILSPPLPLCRKSVVTYLTLTQGESVWDRSNMLQQTCCYLNLSSC